MSMSMTMFPVIANYKRPGKCKEVPWELVRTWEKQIYENHRQRLVELANRGGLSAGELWLAANRLSILYVKHIPPDADDWLYNLVLNYRAPSYWPHLLARVLYVPGIMAACSKREAEEAINAAADIAYTWANSHMWKYVLSKNYPSWSKFNK